MISSQPNSEFILNLAAKGRLETEGIPVFLASEHHVWMNWSYAQALGGIQLRVSPQNLTAAQEILKIAGGVILTTITDVIGFVVFLGLASLVV
jgi:hypothetical protein